jgi:hypothetical protein
MSLSNLLSKPSVVLQPVAACCSLLQPVADCVSLLHCRSLTCWASPRIHAPHCVAVCRFVLIDLLNDPSAVLQRVAACCSVLQRVAACCSCVLPFVTACCCVLQFRPSGRAPGDVAACCSLLLCRSSTCWASPLLTKTSQISIFE